MADDTRVPPLDGGTFITDGGMETTLIFRQGLELPDFASFVLLDDDAGVEALRAYFRPYLDLARDRGVGILLDTPTWRANADWGGASATRRSASTTSTAARSRYSRSCATRRTAGPRS